MPLFLKCKNDLPLLISCQSTYPYMPYGQSMAGVLELIGEYFFKPSQCIGPRVQSRYDLTLLELEIAKEILQEVFGIAPEDVEEMIQQRLIEL